MLHVAPVPQASAQLPPGQVVVQCAPVPQANVQPPPGQVNAGQIRDDVEPYELLRAVGNLSIASAEDETPQKRRMVDLLIDGLRYGAPGARLPLTRRRRKR